MPPKKVKKVKKPRRKTKTPTQTQTQKQVVNINFEKPKEKKRKKKKSQPKQFVPAISTMNMLSSDTARFDTLYNRLYDLQNQKGFPTPPPPPSPMTATKIKSVGTVPIATPFNVELFTATTPPPVKELPVAEAVEIVNPPLFPNGVLGGIKEAYNIFNTIMAEEPDLTPPKAKVKKSRPPPDAPIPETELRSTSELLPINIPKPKYLDLMDSANPLLISNEPPIPSLQDLMSYKPKPQVITFDMDDIDDIDDPPKLTFKFGDNQVITFDRDGDVNNIDPYSPSVNVEGWAMPPEGLDQDLLVKKQSTFERGVDLKKLKEKLKKNQQEASALKAEKYKGVGINVMEGLTENDNLIPTYTRPIPFPLPVNYNTNPIVASTNTSREPVPSLVRGFETLGAEERVSDEEYEPTSLGALFGRQTRADKGVKRPLYKPTLDKIKADEFRNETLLKNIFGAWRNEATDSVSL